MKNELPVNTVVKYKEYNGETGRATICGYDVFRSKYHVMKHSFDDVPMKNFKIWLFENEIVDTMEV